SKPTFPDAYAAIPAKTPPISVDGLAYRPSQPTVAQYQMTIERDLGHGVIAEVGYSGSRGLHLVGDVNNINTSAPQYVDGQIYFPAGGTVINPNFGSIGMRLTNFDSHYNALIADVRARLGNRLQVQGKFGWSHSIDDDSVAIYDETATTEKVPTMFDYRENMGSSDFDCRLTFAANFVWAIPGSRSRAANVFLGGWQLDGLTQVQSGNPFNPVVGFDN